MKWVVLVRRWLSVALAVGIVWLGVPVSADTPPQISSLSAVVYEPQSGTVLYEKAGDIPRPMASTTKLMTALLASERLDAESTVTVPELALPVEGSQIGLAVGDTITVRDLLAGLLLASGNDTANVLALSMADSLPAFAVLMNKRAAALGMTHTTFVTPSGLDGGDHSASARDMALLGAAVLKQPLLAQLCAAKTASLTVSGKKMTVKNHNKLLTLTDGCIGLKTGFTKKAGRCLVSAVQRDGITLIVATLNGGDYWNDHLALYDYGFSLVERQPLSAQLPVTIPVAGGVTSGVAVTCTLPQDAVMMIGEKITSVVELPSFVWAPVAVGDALGCITFYAGERQLARVPVTAKQRVDSRPVPTGFARWWRHVVQMFKELIR